MAPSNASGEQQTKGAAEEISVRIISNRAQEGLKRQATTMAAGETESDGEEESTGCCLFRSRSMTRKLYPNGASRASYSRLEADDPEDTNSSAKPTKGGSKVKLQRSRSVCAQLFFCCGPRTQVNYTTVEVRSVDATQDTKWEVDVNEHHCKPAYWRHLARKLTSHGHVRRPSRVSDWLSYDAHDYQMNFDDGCGRENHCVAYPFMDAGDDSATRARAMYAALLKKSGTSLPGSPMSPVLSPLPVKMVSKEDIEKSKQGFVPIWQRRQGAPPIKLDLRQRSGPMD